MVPDGSVTTATTWIDWHEYGATITFSPILRPRPKSWRWFDVFRTHLQRPFIHGVPGIHRIIFRVQERYPLSAFTRRKRKQFLLSLRA
jgi:hypothetical protein